MAPLRRRNRLKWARRLQKAEQRVESSLRESALGIEISYALDGARVVHDR
jgi:hypothetical protein